VDLLVFFLFFCVCTDEGIKSILSVFRFRIDDMIFAVRDPVLKGPFLSLSYAVCISSPFRACLVAKISGSFD
jgi:hypothetical protein